MVKCTQSFKSVVDNIFELTLDLEQNHFNPNPSSFTNVLQPIQDMIQICTNISIDAVKYTDCINRVESVLPSVGNLIEHIEDKDTKDIIRDVSEIGLELLNGITYCMDA